MRTLNRCPDCGGPVTLHCEHSTLCTWVRCLTRDCGGFGEGDGSRWVTRRKAA